MASALAPIVILAGPTGVGKTDIALALAEKINGEIIGADAFQIYRGLDILTAKPTPEQLARCAHHCIGCVPLTTNFDVAQYRELAERAIAEISARGKTPIVVGGTGFYTRALTQGLAELPAANHELRAELETQSLAELQTRYRALDPAGATLIDLQNPRRLIRAIEVCILTGEPFSSFHDQAAKPIREVRGVFLTRDRDDLHARILQRAKKMMVSGAIDEVREILSLTAIEKIGKTAAQVIGLREIESLLRGEISRDECIERIQIATRQYAKRQLTWFRREATLTAINLTTCNSIAASVKLVLETLREAPPPPPQILRT